MSPSPAAPLNAPEVVRKTARRLWWGTVCLLLVLVVLTALRQGWLTPNTRVYLGLPGASGLDIGAPVRLRGFQIGEVESIQLQNDLTVLAILRLQSDKLPLLSVDTKARMARDTPVAAKHIDLYPNPGEPVRLTQGKRLSFEEGQEIDDLLATVKRLMEQMNTTLGKVQPILDNVQHMSAEMAMAMPELRQTGKRVAGSAEMTAKNVQQTSADVNAMVSDFAANRQTLLTQVQAVLGSAQRSGESVDAMLKDLRRSVPPAVQSSQRLLNDAQDMTDGLKQSWPFSMWLKKPAPQPSTLDSFEGTAP